MNEIQKIYYLIGLSNDSTRCEIIDNLKNFTDVDESKIESIIDDIIVYNEELKNMYVEKGN